MSSLTPETIQTIWELTLVIFVVVLIVVAIVVAGVWFLMRRR